jgi:hypothetical protein
VKRSPLIVYSGIWFTEYGHFGHFVDSHDGPQTQRCIVDVIHEMCFQAFGQLTTSLCTSDKSYHLIPLTFLRPKRRYLTPLFILRRPFYFPYPYYPYVTALLLTLRAVDVSSQASSTRTFPPRYSHVRQPQLVLWSMPAPKMRCVVNECAHE